MCSNFEEGFRMYEHAVAFVFLEIFSLRLNKLKGYYVLTADAPPHRCYDHVTPQTLEKLNTLILM